MSDNREQREYWNGPGGQRWATHQEALDRMVRPFGLAALERLAPRAGEHVLDVGCGCGDSSLSLAERVGPTGSITGIDLSVPMLARARERLPSATLIAGDVAEQIFERRFDALYSRFGVMFFVDPVAAFRHMRTLLAGQGSSGPASGARNPRLGFVCWRAQAENTWGSVPCAAVRSALPGLPLGVMDTGQGPGPFALADRDLLARILREGGFATVDIEPFDAEVELANEGLDAAVRFSLTAGPATRLLAQASPEEKARAAAAVAEALAPHLNGDRVVMGGAAWTVLARP